MNRIADGCQIRPFTRTDKPALISLLLLNTPRYFDPSEESDFSSYLDNHTETYFVTEINWQIIGAGGINYFPDKKLARLSWDIMHPAYQGKGLGTALANYRLNLLRNDPAINLVEVRTSQLAYKFYQKLGFETVRTKEDFWAPGFDLYQRKLHVV